MLYGLVSFRLGHHIGHVHLADGGWRRGRHRNLRSISSIVYLISRRSLMPIIAGHAVVDFVIEPWLFMVAITMSQAR